MVEVNKAEGSGRFWNLHGSLLNPDIKSEPTSTTSGASARSFVYGRHHHLLLLYVDHLMHGAHPPTFTGTITLAVSFTPFES